MGLWEEGAMPIQILVVDEQAVYRVGLRELIAAKIPRVEVIEASSLVGALPCALRSNTFDLVLLGVDLSKSTALDALKAAREALAATRFAIVSAAGTRADILASLAAGFHGFISKRQSDTDVLSAITDILSGRICVPESLAELGEGDALSSQSYRETLPTLLTEADIPKLTKRQREVLSLLARGLSNKEIARALDIAEATTKTHITALLRGLGVRNRTAAAFKAAKLVNSTELLSAS